MLLKLNNLPYGYPTNLSKESLQYIEQNCQHIPYEACNMKLIAECLTNGDGWAGVYHGTMQVGHNVLHAAARGAKWYGKTLYHDLIQNVDGTGTPGPIAHFILKIVGG